MNSDVLWTYHTYKFSMHRQVNVEFGPSNDYVKISYKKKTSETKGYIVFNLLIRDLYKKILYLTATRKIICMGDSHIRVFSHPFFKLAFPLTYFDILAIDGATASGIKNPNSKTQAYNNFTKRLNTLSHPHTIIFCLGEVDTGFVIWWRAAKYNLPVAEMLNQSTSKYAELIFSVAASHKVIVLSAPLPTIEDGDYTGHVAKARREINVPQAERIALTLKFNQHMKAVFEKSNICYLDLDDESLDIRTGLVKTELKNRKPMDHHYNKTEYAKLIISHLQSVL